MILRSRTNSIAAALSLLAFGASSLTGCSQARVEERETNQLISQGTKNNMQDWVIPREGCGSGCHYEIKALSNPKYSNDGWVSIKVEKTFRHYDIEGNPLDFRGTKYGSKEIGWNFANCKEEKFRYGLNPDRSDARRKHVYFINGGIKEPNISTADGMPFQQFSRLCPKHCDDYQLVCKQAVRGLKGNIRERE